MTKEWMHDIPRNLVVGGGLIFILFFSAWNEGYLTGCGPHHIAPLFGAELVAGCLVALWLACSVSAARFTALVLTIFIIEYIKETIGIRSKAWTYHGSESLYVFGVWAWVLGSVTVCTISMKGTIRLLRWVEHKLPDWSEPLQAWLDSLPYIMYWVKRLLAPVPGWFKKPVPRWTNPAMVVVCFWAIPLSLWSYWDGVGLGFMALYCALFLLALYTSTLMSFPVFFGLVITAWVVGFVSEYLGSTGSGIWTFTHNPDYPPFWLIFGAWPLEISAQYAISTFLAREHLYTYTYAPGQGPDEEQGGIL